MIDWAIGIGRILPATEAIEAAIHGETAASLMIVERGGAGLGDGGADEAEDGFEEALAIALGFFIALGGLIGAFGAMRAQLGTAMGVRGIEHETLDGNAVGFFEGSGHGQMKVARDADEIQTNEGGALTCGGGC